jgi:hypothetical protein
MVQGKWAEHAPKPALGKTMSVDDNTSKSSAAKKESVTGSKPTVTAPGAETAKAQAANTEAANTEGVTTEGAKTDAARSNKGMGEGQKPVSQAYKDNWNAIFAKKKKKR